MTGSTGGVRTRRGGESAPASHPGGGRAARTRGAARAILDTIMARGMVTASTAVVGVITARTLLPEGRGRYAVLIAIAWAGLVLGGLSADQGQVVLWTDSGRRPALTANALVLGVLLGVVAAPAVGVVTVLAGAGPACTAVMLVSVPILIAWEYLCGIALLRNRTDVLNRATILASLLWCASVIATALAGWLTAELAFALWTVYELVTVVFFVIALRPDVRRFDLGLARRTVGVGLRYHLGLVCTQLLPRIEILLVNTFGSTSQAGLYAVAVTLADLARIPVEALVKVALPRQVEGDRLRAAQITLRAARGAFLMAVVSVGGLTVLAPTLVPLVYGDAFRGSVVPFFCLTPGVVALSVARPIWIFLVRLDRPWTVTTMSVSALALDVLLGVFFIRLWGATGCAAVSSAVLTTLAAAQCAWFLRVTGTPVRRLLPRWSEIATSLSAAGTRGG
ncbi:lipopolysaccharide biosynthesis protein [Sphaerisporangium fuscum]|uniref:lipopolysaccharide biosynthesis protein n=1 Tax=Sphaerisporangium fuscum TaxID=2835868 RepID=UPI001BDBCD2F|nr:oligosaccharide flippase family protein [Sphaerisporangium fuscum]